MCKNNVLKKLSAYDKRLGKGINYLTSGQKHGSNSHLRRVEVALNAYNEALSEFKPLAKDKHQSIQMKIIEYAIVYALWCASDKNYEKLSNALKATGIDLPDGFIPEIENLIGLIKPKKGKQALKCPVFA